MAVAHVLVSATTQPWVVTFTSHLLHGGALSQGGIRSGCVGLTFDDGPHQHWTPRLLDCLEKCGLIGTFFVVGRSVKEHPEIVRETRRRGHEVGTHLYWHRRPNARDTARMNEEIARSRAELEATLGESIQLLRFPYGERCGIDARSIRNNHGLQPVHWTFSSHDSRARSGNEILERVRPRLRGGAIVLMHDCLADEAHGLPSLYNADRTAMLDSIPLIGRTLVEQNLRAVTVSDLIARRSGRAAQ